jgi:DNA-binding beta-propeller fold protein YncE
MRHLAAAFALLFSLVVAGGCSDKGDDVPVTVTGPAGKLYVLNQADTTIYVYDTKTMERLKTVNTRIAKPHYIVFTPDKRFYYVMTVDLSGRIAKFDASNDEFVTDFDLTAAARAVFADQRSVIPAGLCITPDGLHGYMCDYTAGSIRGHIYKVNLSNLAVEKKIQSGAQTHELQSTADGRVIVACNLRSDDLTLVYTDEDTVAFVPIDPDQPSDPQNPRYGPYCVAVDHHLQKAYISCLYANQVRILDIYSRQIVDSIAIPVTQGTSVSGPAMIHHSHNGNFLVLTTRWGNTVVVVDLIQHRAVAEIPIGAGHPFGIAMSDDDSRIYVAASGQPPQHGYTYEIDATKFNIIDSVEVGVDSWGIGWVAE